ncbi:MAG TPA: Clp protease N-terminal domain-containing protein [Pseudonocardiaceae bacterium]|jgi:ATP-dependent Clp protease ATP-binding subunit ClpA|nr:Clp protease N-terminal domain-containing protein [Pseudonocardiaceae bacterium]
MSMFERFTDTARGAVTDAPRHAQRYGDQVITPVHVFAALLDQPNAPLDPQLAEYHVTSAELLAELDASHRRGGLSDADAAALRTIGIDVDEVFGRIERSLGPDVLSLQPILRDTPRPRYPFAPETKQTLEYAVREAATLRRRTLTEEHLLLALLRQPGPAADLLGEHGLRYAEFRARREAA